MQPPEHFVPLPYTSESGVVRGVQKFFDDPDYVSLQTSEKSDFTIGWATSLTPSESLDALDDFIEASDFKNGKIVLKHTFRRPETVFGGSNRLTGKPRDVMNEVRDSGDRVVVYNLASKVLSLQWNHAWPKNFHDISTNEIVLAFHERSSIARFAVDQCMAATAMPGLKSDIDTTLDQFAEYEPTLER